MELALNSFWLVVALVSLGLWWRFHWRPRGVGGKRPAPLRGLVALCCALFILFPVISLTDDLHAEVMAMEDSNSSKRSLRNDAGPLGPAVSGAPPALPTASALAPAISPRGVFVGLVSSSDIRPHSFIWATLSEGRAPPSLK